VGEQVEAAPGEGPRIRFASMAGGGSAESSSKQSADGPSDTLAEIVPDFLYLSGLEAASQLDVLKAAGITHVLTVGSGMPALHTQDVGYQLIDSLEDNSEALIIVRFQECFSFIDLVKSQNGRLLVHCEGGVSRSATICAAYLMKEEKMTPVQAIDFLQSKRSKVAPNLGFREQLELFYRCNCEIDPVAIGIYINQRGDVTSAQNSILSQDMFETPPENLEYELATSSKASTFIETVLKETGNTAKKKQIASTLSSDDVTLTGHHRSFEKCGGKSENPVIGLDEPSTARDSPQPAVSKSQEKLNDVLDRAQRNAKLSPTSSANGRAQDDHDVDAIRVDGPPKRRLRTNSSTSCNLEIDMSELTLVDDEPLAAASKPPDSAVSKVSHKETLERHDSTEGATLAVGKVLLGYTMTRADERVVTQWLAGKPQKLTGGNAFKGLRQALRMMRRFVNDPESESSNVVLGLQHSLEHVSKILERFTGFPLHSQEFMRLLQSDLGLGTTLAKLEEEFKTALDDVRAANKVEKGNLSLEAQNEHRATEGLPPIAVEPLPGSETLQSPTAVPPAPAPAPVPAPAPAPALTPTPAPTSPSAAISPLPPLVTENLEVALPSVFTESKVLSSAESDDLSSSPKRATPPPPLKLGTKTPGRPVLIETQDNDLEGSGASGGMVRRRRRSATIDLLLLLSKLGLRREEKVSDHLYHSLSQFLEGGNKEMSALEKLDESSAIELLGYLESFPDNMKSDPRLERLAVICKARLILMVAVETVDGICNSLLQQRRVTGHVRDVVTYCFNFSGALIGTQMLIIKRAKEELFSKAAQRIQVWRRKLREAADEKEPEELRRPSLAFHYPHSSRSYNEGRRNSLRTWQSNGPASPSSISSPTTPQQRLDPTPERDIESECIQSRSVVTSINLAVSASQMVENGPSLQLGLQGRPARRAGRQTLTERPHRVSFPVSPGHDSEATHHGPHMELPLHKLDRMKTVPSWVSRNGVPPIDLGHKLNNATASVASSTSISNSAFYLSSELSPRTHVEINPVHALQGIVRHLSRVVVSEARQEMDGAFSKSQKLKMLQDHATRLRAVHPRVCVSDNETRAGLSRLPKASRELEKYLAKSVNGANQTPYCFDFEVGVLAFFPPCELDAALQPPNDTSANFRLILSTVFDLMPVETEALHDLTETAVLSQHASAGYALTTTLHYVDKLSKTSYMNSHHLGDETIGVEGSVTGGYVRYDKDSDMYIFTEESGHYGRRWTNPGTRQGLDTFMAESNLEKRYKLKPFYRPHHLNKRGSVSDLFFDQGSKDAMSPLASIVAGDASSALRGLNGVPGATAPLSKETNSTSVPIAEAIPNGDSKERCATPTESNKLEDTDWDFGE